MCHGGWYDGEKYEPCPSKRRCFQVTRSRELESAEVPERPQRHVRLPVMNPRRKTSNTPDHPPTLTWSQRRALKLDALEDEIKEERGSYREREPLNDIDSKYLRVHRRMIQEREAEAEARAEIAAEEAAEREAEETSTTPGPNKARKVNYGHRRHTGTREPLTPVYLPPEKSDLRGSLWRLLGNMLQAMFAAAAQQIVELLRSVNLFPTWGE